MFSTISSSTLSLAAAHSPFNISGPGVAFSERKLEEQTKVGRDSLTDSLTEVEETFSFE